MSLGPLEEIMEKGSNLFSLKLIRSAGIKKGDDFTFFGLYFKRKTIHYYFM
jgi:hypothetical protein